MAVTHLGMATPANTTPVQVLAETIAFDYFVSVSCANKVMGDVRVSVFSKALLDSENEYLYFVKSQSVSGNSTFETKKIHLPDDHALYVQTERGDSISFAVTGLKTDRIV